MKLKHIIISTIVTSILAGCDSSGSNGGNGGSSGSNRDPLPTKESVRQILNLLKSYSYSIHEVSGVPDQDEYPLVDDPRWGSSWESNNNKFHCKNIMCRESGNFVPQVGMLRRFNPTPGNPIHIYFNNPDNLSSEVPQDIYEGLNLVVDTIGYNYPLFNWEYGQTLEEVNIAIRDIEGKISEPDYSSIPSEGGIIFSIGTYDGSGQTGLCGSVYNSPWAGTGGFIITVDDYLAKNKGWLWVSLPDETQPCGISPDLVAHEMMHAMGVLDHFAGFGGDNQTGEGSAAFGHQAREVLRLLYNHEPGSPVDDIVIPDY